MSFELTHDACALDRIVDLGIARIDVVRQRAFLQHPFGGIFERRQHVFGRDPQFAGKAFGEAMRIVDRRRPRRRFLSAISSAFCQTGLPSTRQNSENAQRGSGSPGYHLPCP